MADIYDLHSKAFARVSAFVILDATGERVATVAIKYPADGAGKLFAYTHYLGLPMTRGWASGYGYDKRSPAVASGFSAARAELRKRLATAKASKPIDDGTGPYIPSAPEIARLESILAAFEPFHTAIAPDDGEYWDRRLEKAGFRVIQAV